MQPVHWHHLAPASVPLIVPQNLTEELLLDRSANRRRRPARRHCAARLLEPGRGEVAATTGEGDRLELSAHYVVGADGGRSIVRREAGIGFEGHDATFTGIVADLRAERLGDNGA